ncbi:prepilin-type N-terminal cleavage/methylation domain-containing protein [Massilia sp. Bi118]|uniref:pilus assembly FimT family protein n=1 Tax=Massilia sp. Bi118 TaxID=2822346 RepID=UPI0025B6FFBF
MRGRHGSSVRAAGFTMVELIVVLILVGILGAIGAARFFDRAGFDAAAFGDQSAAMLRYAQKLAIAQRRKVYVQTSTSGLSLCYASASPCGTADRVPAPSGANSGSSATRAFCTGGGAYDPAWDCEGVPTGATLSLNPGAPGNMYFDGLGRPYLAGDSGDSSFVALTLTIKGDDVTRTVSVAQETGYVF